MKSIKLNRQNHLEPNHEELDTMLRSLKEVLYNKAFSPYKMHVDIETILAFQDEDGSFKLLDSFKIDSDASIEFCFMPTYLCTAILMKAYTLDKDAYNHYFEETLRTALKTCSKMGFAGHGLERLQNQIEELNIFMEAGVREFLLLYPDFCKEFTDMIGTFSEYFADRGRHSYFTDDWGADYTAEIKAINDYFSHYDVFVYGTLLHGEANNQYFLHNSSYIGKASINRFVMYDIGSFPGIVEGFGVVKGELYKVSKETLKAIDKLEGEGSLYVRRCVIALSDNGDSQLAFVYVYNHGIDGLELIPEEMQPYTYNWKERNDNYVWYVSYGSNMLRERFVCYIKGGQFEGCGKNHEPCRDTSDPVAVATYDIPYDMYFRNSSTSWGGKGVSFLDISKQGHALGVAYLITREQFEHVACQENGGHQPEYSSWYNTVISIGMLDGHDVVTITNNAVCGFNAPSDGYLETLHRGIAENYKDMTSDEIDRYLRSCIR